MKKLLALFAVLFLAFGLNAGTAPAYSAGDATYEFGVDTMVSEADGFDTISANTDTVTLFTKRPIKNRMEAILVTSTQGTVDFSTNHGYIEALVYNSKNTLLYTIVIDSLVAGAAGTDVVNLSVGARVIGTKWTLRIRCTGDPGTVRFGPVGILERRPIANFKMW